MGAYSPLKKGKSEEKNFFGVKILKNLKSGSLSVSVNSEPAVALRAYSPLKNRKFCALSVGPRAACWTLFFFGPFGCSLLLIFLQLML